MPKFKKDINPISVTEQKIETETIAKLASVLGLDFPQITEVIPEIKVIQTTGTIQKTGQITRQITGQITEQILEEIKVPPLPTPSKPRKPPKIIKEPLIPLPPPIPLPIIFPKLFLFPKGKIRKIKRAKQLKKEIFAMLPDFTSRMIGLKPTAFKGAKQALKEMKKIKTGLEIRRGAVIRPSKVPPKKKISKSILDKSIRSMIVSPFKVKSLKQMMKGLSLPKIPTPKIPKSISLFPKKKRKTSNNIVNINQILKKIKNIDIGGGLKLI